MLNYVKEYGLPASIAAAKIAALIGTVFVLSWFAKSGYEDLSSKIDNLTQSLNAYNMSKFDTVAQDCNTIESVIVPQCSNRQMEELLDNAFDQGYRLGAE